MAATAAVERIPERYLRTRLHPSASAVPDARTFDHLYDSATSFDEVYEGIVEALVAAAAASGEILYAVPGSPTVAERSVELLRASDRVDVEVVPGLSFTDLAWDRLGVDPLAAGARLIDGRRFGIEAAGDRGPLLVAQCDTRQVLSDVKLALGELEPRADATGNGSPPSVVVLSHLGLPDESVRPVPWFALDREVEPDHLTSLYVPRLAAPVAGEVATFVELVRSLRATCPWDREQTHASLTRHLVEEAYEVLEAIADLPSDGAYEHLEEELGDVLFQVVFHSTLATEEGRFTLADVPRGIHDKLVRRHPHVFGTVQADTAGEVVGNWERIKRAEKGRSSAMDGIPSGLPSLLYAAKVQRKAAASGITVTAEGPAVLVDPAEAIDAVGVRLFATVATARAAGVDPEAALLATTTAFRRRFEAFERLAAGWGVDVENLPDEERFRLWDTAGDDPAGPTPEP